MARAVLERLLQRAERARRRTADEKVSLRMASVVEYTALHTLPELEAFHADVALAERVGAITVQRETRSGDGAKLLRIGVLDSTALAKHLGISLLDERVADAENLLAPWRARFPVLDEVFVAWRANRKLRGAGPAAATELADAARAVAARADDTGHERILRRESVRLFGDSKRLEKLTAWLEILVTGELAATGLAKDEVWSAIGLRREPQPLLLSGYGTVHLADSVLPLVRPYLGLPVDAVQRVVTMARCLVSIENLASFHDATTADGAEDALLVYTGGMPSPAWRAAYVRVLGGLSPALPVYHWGDIDEGGFRIAAVLARACKDAGRTLQQWRMSPDALPNSVVHAARVPTPTSLNAMCRWAEQAGWGDVAQALRKHPLKLEQESLDPELPVHSHERGRVAGGLYL